MRKTGYFLLILLIAACGKKEDTLSPEYASITESVYAVGTIKSAHQYEAHSLTGGVIETFYVKEGDVVKTGDPLLKISNIVQQLNSRNAALNAGFSDYRANLQQLEDLKQTIDLLEQKAETDSLNFIRQKNLWSQNIGSEVELEQRELAFKNSKNSFLSAKIRYDNLKRQLEFTSQQSKNNLEIVKNMENDFTLKSEINGMIYKIYKEKGELVNQQVPLILLGESDRYILEMQVDENDIFKIKEGQKVLVTLDSYKGKVFEARITSHDLVMNPFSKSFTVEAEFVKAPEKLFPNASFEANIVINQKEKALLIPRRYLWQDKYVIKENGDTIEVKIGLKDYQKAEILSGITENDEIMLPR